MQLLPPPRTRTFLCHPHRLEQQQRPVTRTACTAFSFCGVQLLYGGFLALPVLILGVVGIRR